VRLTGKSRRRAGRRRPSWAIASLPSGGAPSTRRDGCAAARPCRLATPPGDGIVRLG